MYCEMCDKLVETDFFYIEEWDDIDQHHYGDHDCEGKFDPDDAGEVVELGGELKTINVKVDYCANCGYTLQLRTFLR